MIWAAIKGLSLGTKLAIFFGVIAAFFGTYQYGHHNGYTAGVNISKAQIAQYEKDVVELNSLVVEATSKVREKIITKYVDKIIYVKEKAVKNDQIIKNVVPSQCTMSNGWVRAHDDVASGAEIDSGAAADGTSSGIKDTEALSVVAENYKRYHELEGKLEALQDIVRAHNKAIDDANAKIKENK